MIVYIDGKRFKEPVVSVDINPIVDYERIPLPLRKAHGVRTIIRYFQIALDTGRYKYCCNADNYRKVGNIYYIEKLKNDQICI